MISKVYKIFTFDDVGYPVVGEYEDYYAWFLPSITDKCMMCERKYECLFNSEFEGICLNFVKKVKIWKISVREALKRYGIPKSRKVYYDKQY